MTGQSEIIVGVITLVSGMLLQWMRTRRAREVAMVQAEDGRERRVQEAINALIDDYRQRLADAQSELEVEARRRRALGQEIRRLERRRKHFHPRGPKVAPKVKTRTGG